MRKILKRILLTFLIFLLAFAGYLFIGSPPPAKEITWGVNFSQKHAELLGLDWKETYLALLDDLGTKNLKVAAQWDLIEQEKDKYDFEDLDWQIQKADEKGAKLLLVIGMKTGRWPECHIPDWAKNFSKEEQQKEILEILEQVVVRYRGWTSVWAWQVENEPFFPFGECPWTDKKFLEEEINLVKNLDSLKRPIVISDSGEGSFWLQAARFGDIAGTTMYKKVWFRQLGFYIHYPFPPAFYWRKAQIIKKIFNKKVIVIELQAEPWGPDLLYNSPLAEQEKTMNLEKFKYNIEFAKKTGFDTFYLWGGEWWFWMKTKQNNPGIWDEAKKQISEETKESKDTCEILGGNICGSYQACDGTVLSVSDTNRCCLGQCKLPKSFDWRNRHGENWNSPVKNQLSSPICGMFSRIGALEAQINLYYNQHINIDLSEQMFVDCLNEGEIKELSVRPDECMDFFSAPDYVYCRWTYGGGIVEETCDPFSESRGETTYPMSNCNSQYVCNNWREKVWKISNFVEYNFREDVEIPENEKNRVLIGLSEDQFKAALITKGPMDSGGIGIFGGHGMVIVGYETDPVDNKTIWIFKNSWGEDYEEKGYLKQKVSFETLYGLIPLGPFLSPPGKSYQILCVDKDKDGFCNWGISENKPSTCSVSCKPEKDWDDSNPDIGALGLY